MAGTATARVAATVFMGGGAAPAKHVVSHGSKGKQSKKLRNPKKNGAAYPVGYIFKGGTKPMIAGSCIIL